MISWQWGYSSGNKSPSGSSHIGMSEKKIIIIGNGVTGATAARHLRKRSDHRILMVSGETDLHFSRTALMYIFMGDLTFEDTQPYPADFWEKNRINLKRAWVRRIHPDTRSIEFADGSSEQYDELILATGARSNKFGWPGQDLRGVQGLYSHQDLQSMENLSPTTRHAVIVGGGLIGVEVAEMLLTRGISITFLVREKNFWDIVLPEGSAKMINREVLRHGIDLRLETELDEILPDENGRARAVTTKSGEEIACQMVFLTVGVSPNIGFIKDSGIECDRGVLVDREFRTSAPHVWAGGDCAQHREVPDGRRPVEQVWYTGKMHGEHIAANLCGDERPYRPGVWFNSAKFFDIEYQTYGMVLPQPKENEEDFYWEHPDGDKSLNLRFDRESGVVTGVNVFGLRHRHAVWEYWIGRGHRASDVMTNLGAANFDPEFYRQHEEEIIAAFNGQFPLHQATLKTRKGLFSRMMEAVSST